MLTFTTLKSKIIAGATGALVLAGGITGGILLAGNNIDTAQSSSLPVSSTQENSSMETTSTDTAAVDAAITSGIAQIQSATDQALQQIQSAASAAPAASTPAATTSIPATGIKISEPKIIPIEIISENDLSKIVFTSVKLLPSGEMSINYTQTVKGLETGNLPWVNFKITPYFIDSIGEKHECTAQSGGINMWFTYSDPAHLSVIKLTYQLEGGASRSEKRTLDPVTVEINIPGI